MGIFSDEDEVLDEFGPKRRGRYPHRRPTASSSTHRGAHRGGKHQAPVVHAQEPGVGMDDDEMFSPVEQISFAKRKSVSPVESFRARSRRSSVSSSFEDHPAELRSSSDDSAIMSVGATRRRRVKRELGGGSSSNVSLWNKDGGEREEGRGRGKTRKKSKSKKRKTKRGDELGAGGEEKKRGVLEAVSRAFDFDREERDKEKDDGDSQKSGEVIDVVLFRRNLNVKGRGGGVPPITTNAHVQGIFPPASPIGASPMPHQFLSNQSSNPNLHHTQSNTSSNSGHYATPAVQPPQESSGGILDFVPTFSSKKKSGKKGAQMVVAVESEIVRPGTADSGSTGKSVGNNATPSSSSQQSHSASPFVWVSRANMAPSELGDQAPGPIEAAADPKSKRPMKKRTASVPVAGFDSMMQGSSTHTQMKFQPQRRGEGPPMTVDEFLRDEYEQERTSYESDVGVLSITAHRRMVEAARQGQRSGRADESDVPPMPSLKKQKGR
ncbi:hypothetical protein FA13DRAFT_202510 [Coprinellus micaceus]|uniref:Uncharacterized protein n=1 Tax=Coprinellus micaceus TaxID=71717 RepID=A0A4Y7SFQ7_COPMI|nr:hypothetical protein FA13DRAFT_202510 [Coprinellus micaceus]